MIFHFSNICNSRDRSTDCYFFGGGEEKEEMHTEEKCKNLRDRK